MAPVFSKVAASNSAVLGASVGIVYWISTVLLRRGMKRDEVNEVAYSKKEDKNITWQVDMSFYRQIKTLLKIILPSVFAREFAYVVMIASIMVGRTWCDIWKMHNETLIERALISEDIGQFRKNLEAFIFAMPMLSLLNNAIKLVLNKLKLSFRSRLTKHLYDQYLTEGIYYKMSNIDNQMSNPDQVLTQDVETFCTSVTDLYSNVSKPLFEVIMFVQRLSSTIGAEGPILMMTYLLLAGLLLTRLSQHIEQMNRGQKKLEGLLRYVNSRIIQCSESIAFYNGHGAEKITMLHAFKKLVNHVRMSQYYTFTVGYIDNIIARYWTTVVGYLLISHPFLGTQMHSLSHSERLESYYKSVRMLQKLAEATSRLVLAGREMTKLAGPTVRITQLIKVSKDLSEGCTIVADGSKSFSPGDDTSKMMLIPGSGTIINVDNLIQFDRVTLATPNGDILIEEISFEIKSGMNVLVQGPNGCGKSSLLRVLNDLWPIYGGTLKKPEKKKLFYIPQIPYMTLGTLRDQFIYPDTLQDLRRKGKTDSDLEFFLEMVQLKYLLAREKDWNSIKDWMNVLNGEEKQRVAIARLFYHRPQFAALDECTSSVDIDVEESMYHYCKEMSISLLTVSDRKSLWKHHQYTLFMDGRGNYKFKPIRHRHVQFESLNF